MMKLVLVIVAVAAVARCEVSIPEKYRDAKSIAESPTMQEFYKNNGMAKKTVEVEPFIIGGSNATLGQIPYQALLFIVAGSSTYLCGGSLIHREWVLTVS
jgi:hypothetical protein